jgi:hypothetical protein
MPYDWHQDEKAKFTVRQPSSQALKGKFYVQKGRANLKGKTNIRHSTTIALKGTFVVRHSSSAALKGKFVVDQEKNVKGKVFLSHRLWLNQGLTTADLVAAGVIT